MKALLISLAILLSPMASAYWYVEAESPQAIGWGQSMDLSTAKQIALRECARRTSSSYVCFVTSVIWID